MAQVADRTELDTWINRSLVYLTSAWAAIPEVVADWDAWDEADRLDFVLEWPLREDRLLQVRRWNAERLLSAVQHQRYKAVEALVQQHRPALELLLRD